MVKGMRRPPFVGAGYDFRPCSPDFSIRAFHKSSGRITWNRLGIFPEALARYGHWPEVAPTRCSLCDATMSTGQVLTHANAVSSKPANVSSAHANRPKADRRAYMRDAQAASR